MGLLQFTKDANPLDSNGSNYASVIICKFLNEVIVALHKLNHDRFKPLEDYDGKILEIHIIDPEVSIQLVFRPDRPVFISDKQEAPNTILRTQWKHIPRLLFQSQDSSRYLIEGDSYFLEELINSVKSMRPELHNLITPFTGEKPFISISERLNFLASIFSSIEETSVQATQETLSEYFASTKTFEQSVIQLNQLRNKVDRLNAAIRQLEK